MTEQEFENEIMNEDMQHYVAFQKQEDELKSNYKEQLKGLINVTGLFEWLTEDHDGWSPLGIVEIVKTDKQKSGYPKHECCYIKGGSDLFMKCDCDVPKIKYYYVVQQTGMMGDDYSGELLLPLKDGRYFHVSYSC